MLHLVRFFPAFVALTGIVVSLSGCQAIQNTPHSCPCLCYKEKGNSVWMSQAPTSTSLVNCGDLNGTPCTGNAGGSFEGTLQHCGPYTNVGLDPLKQFLQYQPTKAVGER